VFSLSDVVPYEVRLETTLAGHPAVLDPIAEHNGKRARAAVEAHHGAAHCELGAMTR
jgi:hypothetical protein